jgi:hypothetical protein
MIITLRCKVLPVIRLPIVGAIIVITAVRSSFPLFFECMLRLYQVLPLFDLQSTVTHLWIWADADLPLLGLAASVVETSSWWLTAGRVNGLPLYIFARSPDVRVKVSKVCGHRNLTDLVNRVDRSSSVPRTGKFRSHKPGRHRGEL